MPTQHLKPSETEKLEQVLELFIAQVLEKEPELMENEEFVKGLIDNAIKYLQDNNNDISREKIFDKEFIQEFSLCVMIGAAIEKNKDLTVSLHEALSVLTNNKEFMKEFKNLLDNPTPEPGKALEKLLQEHFKPEQIAQLKKGIQVFAQKLTDSMNSNPGKDADNEKTLDHDDAKKEISSTIEHDCYVNLFGLLNSAIAGAHPIPVPSYLGNGMGFNDWNPYDGSAPIDKQNSVNDYQFGDPLGLNASTVQNYAGIAESTVDDFPKLLLSAGIESLTPRPVHH